MKILEVLQSALYNLERGLPVNISIAQGELKNAVNLLEKGYSPNEDFNEVTKGFSVVEQVPEKKQPD